MKWFDRWFYKKSRWCWKRAGFEFTDIRREQDVLDSAAEEYYDGDSLSVPKRCYTLSSGNRSVDSLGSKLDAPASLRLNITRADGGMILEFRTEDPKTDRSHYKLHIINDDEADKATAIGKIITYEFMKL